MKKLLLRVSEAAEMTRLSRGFVYELIKRGQFPHVRIGGAVRVSLEALEKWVAEGCPHAPSARPHLEDDV